VHIKLFGDHQRGIWCNQPVIQNSTFIKYLRMGIQWDNKLTIYGLQEYLLLGLGVVSAQFSTVIPRLTSDPANEFFG